jgi:RNA 2',3'-cyclic 3'-phosphodiesterase
VAALRTFIAINVPPVVFDTITRIQNRFKSLGLHASWVKPGNIHLTLKFLGDTDPGRIPGIQNKLAETLASFERFRLSLNSVGVFPNTKNPRILWVGLKNNDGTLKALQTAIEKTLENLGFSTDPRPFSPHLTLARIKSPWGIKPPKGIKSPRGKKALKDELDAVNQEGISPHPFEVGEIHLYESQLTPKGSIYTVLANFKLNP